MRRFYALKEKISSGQIVLSPEETRHLLCVDRFRQGDTVVVFDGDGAEYEAVMDKEEKGCAVLRIKNKIEKRESNYALKIAVCLPKKGKFENIIEKCTELNVAEIIPLVSRRTIVRIDKSKVQAKLRRWQKKAVESAKQANRAKFPRIKEITPFGDFVKALEKDKSFILIPTLYSNGGLKDVLKRIKKHEDIIILIGPEGGFELEEVKLAEEKGAVAVSLGRTVLRVETAVIFTASVINYEMQACH